MDRCVSLFTLIYVIISIAPFFEHKYYQKLMICMSIRSVHICVLLYFCVKNKLINFNIFHTTTRNITVTDDPLLTIDPQILDILQTVDHPPMVDDPQLTNHPPLVDDPQIMDDIPDAHEILQQPIPRSNNPSRWRLFINGYHNLQWFDMLNFLLSIIGFINHYIINKDYVNFDPSKYGLFTKINVVMIHWMFMAIANFNVICAIVCVSICAYNFFLKKIYLYTMTKIHKIRFTLFGKRYLAHECPICKETDGNRQTDWLFTYCGHNFHIDCLELWKSRINACPVCRKSL